jgi:hypothetical protein
MRLSGRGRLLVKVAKRDEGGSVDETDSSDFQYPFRWGNWQRRWEMGLTLVRTHIIQSMRKVWILVGVAVILVGLVPMSYVEYHLHAHNWTPLQTPVTLTIGDLVTPEFLSDLDGTYVVSLAFAPKDVDREECLVGDSLFKADCEDLGGGLDLDWSVIRRDTSGDTALINNQTYRPQAFGGAGEMQTVLGAFEAKRGDRYKIALRVHKNSPELNEANPKIKVEPHRIYWEEWVELAPLSFGFAGVLGLIGIVIVIYAIRTDKKASEKLSLN